MSEDRSSCLGCAYFRIKIAEPDWSEVTPGSNFAIECWKEKWEFDTYKHGEDYLRDIMNTAKDCQDFRDYKLGLP